MEALAYISPKFEFDYRITTNSLVVTYNGLVEKSKKNSLVQLCLSKKNYLGYEVSGDKFEKEKYHISANSFHGNYSFLNLHKSVETIQGRTLFAEIQYLKLTMCSVQPPQIFYQC